MGKHEYSMAWPLTILDYKNLDDCVHLLDCVHSLANAIAAALLPKFQTYKGTLRQPVSSSPHPVTPTS